MVVSGWFWLLNLMVAMVDGFESVVVGFGCEVVVIRFGGVVLGYELDKQVNYCLVVNYGIW